MVKRLQQELAGEERFTAAFLLGSVVRSQLRSGSDVDVSILLQPGTSFSSFEKIDLAVRLGELCGRELDIGILEFRNLVYAREAYLAGECIYCRDVFAKDLFGATILGLYAALKWCRKVAEDAYRN
ncbi:MAG: nucleotidyltransferase domain-containing protein [Deltaproteobacteria bacterium]|nr:nucleotidyltransferase domain-containing protein [Deltaproteobacteria bacterium]